MKSLALSVLPLQGVVFHHETSPKLKEINFMCALWYRHLQMLIAYCVITLHSMFHNFTQCVSQKFDTLPSIYAIGSGKTRHVHTW